MVDLQCHRPPGRPDDRRATGLVGGTLPYTAAGPMRHCCGTDGTATGSRTFTWTVTDTNRAPALTDPGPRSHAEGDTVSLQLVASDLDDDAVTFGATNLPCPATIDGATGLIGGTLPDPRRACTTSPSP